MQQIGRAGSLSKTLKDAASGKIFDLMNDFGEKRCPMVKEFEKFLVSSEGKLPLHLESVEDLVRWCYPDILRFYFNICFQEGHSSPQKLCCKFHIHILALSLIMI